MYSCNVIYRHGQVMCGGFGSTKRQAERNAAVMGLLWLEDNKEGLKVLRSRKRNDEMGRQTAIQFIADEQISKEMRK